MSPASLKRSDERKFLYNRKIFYLCVINGDGYCAIIIYDTKMEDRDFI